MASRETVPVHRRSLDAITSVFAISVIGLCVWAECLKCLLPSPHDSTDCFMSETVPMTWRSWSLRFVFLSLPGRLCNPDLRTRAVASCRWLAFLCLSLIPTACAVKRWRRIAHQVRILKRPEFDFMWQRDKKRCVCGSVLWDSLHCKAYKLGKGLYFLIQGILLWVFLVLETLINDTIFPLNVKQLTLS